MSDDNPTIDDVILAALDGALEGVRVALPGEILSYDKTSNRATVQVLVMDVAYDENDARTPVPIAPLTDVPVAYYGVGTVRIRVPVKKGSKCWLLFNSSSIARFKGGSGSGAVDPADDRHHHEADAIALPFSIAPDDDDAMIEFTDDGLIKAGGDEPLVKRSEFLGHTHATAGTGPPTPPTTITPPGSSVTFPGTDRLRG